MLLHANIENAYNQFHSTNGIKKTWGKKKEYRIFGKRERGREVGGEGGGQRESRADLLYASTCGRQGSPRG